MKRRYQLLVLMAGFVSVLYGQAPTSNPCSRSRDHWSNEIHWGNVFSADQFPGVVLSKGRLDSLKLHQALKQISQQGGGVFFLKGGTYYLDYDLQMMDNVVIRGQTGANNRWITKLVFPKYVPSFEKGGTPNNTAFKKIVATLAKKNFGLVDVDISGAVIHFKNTNVFYDNVILYRIRQNNAAILDGRYPSKIQKDENHGWQRWPLWNGDNIAVNIENNLVLTQCVLNDSTTYNFPMPNYMTDDGYVFVADTLLFRYELHTGIIVTESNNDGNKNIEISHNLVHAAKSRLSQYLHPGIALYVSNKENEKDKAIINEFIKIPKSKESTYKVPAYIHMPGNVVKDIEDESELLLVDRKFHYSSLYQNNVMDKFDKDVFVSKKSGQSLVYFLMSPKEKTESQAYPLVIFFHGIGEIGADNPLIHFVSAFTKDEVVNQYPCYILAPQLTEQTDSWAGLGEKPSQPVATTLELMEHLKANKQYNIDPDRIYVAGISYGGSGVFEALTKGDNFAAAAVIVSFVHNTSPVHLKKMKNVAFQFGAGNSDSAVPIGYMLAMAQKYAKAGIDVKLNRYNVGHFSWIPLVHDPEFYKWLFSKRRQR